jgi:predicted GNAT family acetyltransferase
MGVMRGQGVTDDSAHQRLVWQEDGEEAELVYRRQEDRLFLVHTGVPKAIVGRGVAGKLVGAAVEWAERDNLTLVPWCPYARKWLRQHGAEAAHVQIDWKSFPTGQAPT